MSEALRNRASFGTGLSAVVLTAIAWPVATAAVPQIVDIRQGTNMALALAPDGQTLVIDLLGQLWRLPSGGGGAQPLTPAGEQARNPRYSRDGTQIVYQRLIGGQWDLWLMDLERDSRQPLTDSPHNEREPDFSTDGKSVVFASDQTDHYCLWSLELATGVLTQLTEEPGEASFPTVSDLGQIAYVLDRTRQSSLRVLSPQGVGLELLTSDKTMSAPSWRPGGGVILFNELDGSRTSQLKMLVIADVPVAKAMTTGEDTFKARAAWPSGAEYIYTADGQIWRRGIAEAGRRPVHLFAAVSVDSAAPPAEQPVLDAPGPHRAFGLAGWATSPDGRSSAFTALGDLWIAERGNVRRLTDDAYVDADPVFTPDGESIVFVSDRGGEMAVWRVSLNGGAASQLTFRAAKAYRPAVAPDGQSVAFLETAGLGPWAPSSLQLLSLRAGHAVETLADGLVEPQRPAWQPDGESIVVRGKHRTVSATPGERRSTPLELRTELAAHSPSAAPRGAERAAQDRRQRAAELELQWSASPGAAERYVIQVGRLFDGIRSDYRRHVDIHVERQRIVAIVGRNLKPLPAKIVDARDATIIPGLIDVHAHQSSLGGERLGRAWLAYGVTTVRELASELPEALERSESWASGRRLGPRLVVTPDQGSEHLAGSTSGASEAIRPYPSLADGLGHSLWRQATELGVPVWQDPALLAELAAHGTAGPHYELETSPLNASYQDSLSRIIASATVTTPALGALGGFRGWLTSAGRRLSGPAYETLFNAGERRRWERAGLAPESILALQQTVARLVRAGGRVAVGTDSPAVPYGLGAHVEMALLSDAGIPNDQVLRLATAQGALALGLEQQLGTVEQGKLADLIVLNGDPLARIGDTLLISAVVKGGLWLDRSDLIAPEPVN